VRTTAFMVLRISLKVKKKLRFHHS
jgi:hypothetical protein